MATKAPKEAQRTPQHENQGYTTQMGYEDVVNAYENVTSYVNQSLKKLAPQGGWQHKQYLVKEGDTIEGIAQAHDTTVDELLKMNHWILIDASMGKISYGGQEFVLRPGMYVQVPDPEWETLGNLYQNEETTYFVQQGDTIDSIAAQFGIAREALLHYNKMTLLDENIGKVDHKGSANILQIGTPLNIPAPSYNIQKSESDAIVQKAGKRAEASENKHMDGFFEVLLEESEKMLGKKPNSQLKYSLGLKIPIATGIFLKLGGGFEQKRKKADVVEHKIEISVGFVADIAEVVKASAEFKFFIAAASGSTKDAVDMFSYGFYKFGRQAADVMNDWDQGFASGGLSLAASAAIYYGLNYMYSDKTSFSERVTDDIGAEQQIATSEARLFGKNRKNGARPFDPTNPNEVSYGGEIKGSAETDMGSLETSAAASVELKNTVNAQTLNKTGIYGAQKDPGFWEDYDVGSKQTATTKVEWEVSVDGNKVKISDAVSYDRYKRNEAKGKYNDDYNWQWSKNEFEGQIVLGRFYMGAQNDALFKLVLAFLIEMKTQLSNKDKEQSASIGNMLSPEKVSIGISSGEFMNSLVNAQSQGVLQAKNAVLAKYKVENSLKDGLKATLILGVLNNVEIDTKFVEFSFEQLNVIGNFEL